MPPKKAAPKKAPPKKDPPKKDPPKSSRTARTRKAATSSATTSRSRSTTPQQSPHKNSVRSHRDRCQSHQCQGVSNQNSTVSCSTLPNPPPTQSQQILPVYPVPQHPQYAIHPYHVPPYAAPPYSLPSQYPFPFSHIGPANYQPPFNPFMFWPNGAVNQLTSQMNMATGVATSDGTTGPGIGAGATGAVIGAGATGAVIGAGGTGAVIGAGGTGAVIGAGATAPVIGAGATAPVIGAGATAPVIGAGATAPVIGAGATAPVIGAGATAPVIGAGATAPVIGAGATAPVIGAGATAPVIGAGATGDVIGAGATGAVIGAGATAPVIGAGGATGAGGTTVIDQSSGVKYGLFNVPVRGNSQMQSEDSVKLLGIFGINCVEGDVECSKGFPHPNYLSTRYALSFNLNENARSGVDRLIDDPQFLEKMHAFNTSQFGLSTDHYILLIRNFQPEKVIEYSSLFAYTLIQNRESKSEKYFTDGQRVEIYKDGGLIRTMGLREIMLLDNVELVKKMFLEHSIPGKREFKILMDRYEISRDCLREEVRPKKKKGKGKTPAENTK